MKKMQNLPGKILHHFEGLGVPSPEMVRQRAIELARIDGREDFSEEDWRRAKLELHGGHHQTASTNGDEEPAEFVSSRDMIPVFTGHHVEKCGCEDPENIGEELIEEGMDEAVHDQMLESRKREDRESLDE